MSIRAWSYIYTVLFAGIAISTVAIANFTPTLDQFPIFAILIPLATLSQLYEVESGRLSYYPHFVFFFAGSLLLQPFLFVLVILVPHLVEWGKEFFTKGKHLRDWYIQPFNISSHISAGVGARLAFDLVGGGSALEPTLRNVFAAFVAAGVYVAVNHLSIGQALAMARRVSWRESGVLSVNSLLPDYILSCLGYVVAVLWAQSPWLILPALMPLFLLYRALIIPALEHQARTDFKTGLWNAGHFTELLARELNRASRTNQSLALIMADLDLLRNINNSYGHLAGDAVLAGIGKIIRTNIRDYDLAGRFGGEEFAIALLEAGHEEAKLLAERLRQEVESTGFQVQTNPQPIRATMSFGTACFPGDGDSPERLIHAADVAVYHAKLQGRNRVVYIADVPEAVRLAIPINPERMLETLDAEFLVEQGSLQIASA